ncbi:FecR family protein [Steroidobacter flavus]|uniref:FecR family protein n=1 Tax=Steroidobacter flavus TaxID=1842136 RepID=A0ABV8SVQ5_9GAMM
MRSVLTSMDRDVIAKNEAEAWFVRLMSPECSAAERRSFEQWRASSSVNEEAYVAIEKLWQRLDGMEEDEVIGRHAAAALKPEPAPRRWPLALAASVIAALVGVGVVDQVRTSATVEHYQAQDQSRKVTLSDGSEVTLDLATEIDVRLSRSERNIKLVAGRALFDVAHDASRPFRVDTGHGKVTALGTQFQVDVDSDQVIVTLLEGSVSVSPPEAHRQEPTLRLAPGQQARYSNANSRWAQHDVDAAAVVSWSSGFHVFSATPLGEAVREINRYSATKLRLADPSLESLVISGNFKTGDAETISSAWPIVLPVTLQKVGAEIVIAPR